MKRMNEGLLIQHIRREEERRLDAPVKSAESADSAQLDKMLEQMVGVIEQCSTEVNVLVGRMASGDSLDLERYVYEINAMGVSVEEMHALLEGMNALKNIRPEQQRGIQEAFGRYIFFIDLLEINTSIDIETAQEVYTNKEPEKALAERVSSKAMMFLQVAQNVPAAMYDDTDAHVEVIKVNVENSIGASPWMIAYCSKLLQRFGNGVEEVSKPNVCADEIYEELAHDIDMKTTSMGLATAIDYKMVYAAELLATQPDVAEEEIIRVRHGLETLRDWWAKRCPEIAVKYEALDAGLDQIIALLSAFLSEGMVPANEEAFEMMPQWGNWGAVVEEGSVQDEAELLN